MNAAIKVGVAVALCLGVAYAGSIVTDTSVETWYRTLEKPPATPPDWVFPVVWTSLFVMMGAALGLIWIRAGWAGSGRAVGLFVTQLALNFLWSALFFGLRSPGLAGLEIVILWSVILATIVAFRPIRPAAAMLLVPYLAWVSYAAYLNAGIWYLNRFSG